MKIHRALLVTVATLVILMAACGPQATPDNRAADERAIRETEAEWSKVGGTKDLERFLSYYADDASVLAPNMPTATGKDAIRAALGGLFSSPGFSISFQATKADVARSGDLGYTQGTYALTMNDPKGNPINDKGKYVTVWKKQADSKWKAVADMFSSDLPPPAPAK